MFVFLSSLLIVGAVSDLELLKEDILLECKTVWYEEEAKWITLCGEKIELIAEYKQSKKLAIEEVEIKESVEDVSNNVEVKGTIVTEIFDKVEEGFGIVPKDQQILEIEIPVGKNTPKTILPKINDKTVSKTFVEIFADKLDVFFSSPFQALGFGKEVEPIEEELEFIEKETLGDVEFEMNVYADQVVKDIHGLTKGFGVVTHAYVPLKFLNAYIQEVGVEGATIRMHHKYDVLGRDYPPTDVHRKLVNNGAKVMVSIKGIPAEEGIAYCSEYSGSDCIKYEANGPAKDMQGWKDYVYDVVSFYNTKDINYFIIWNEPNYLLENWKMVCNAPNDCWMPTLEEFVDLTVAAVESVYEVDVNNEVGVDATSNFVGIIADAEGNDGYVTPSVFDALEAKGLSANHHFHHYQPDPYFITPGSDTDQVMDYLNEKDVYLGSNLDEFSDGSPGQGGINRDGIHASSSAMALIGNMANHDVDNMGWFQLNSDTHEPGTLEGRFLEWNENMIDKSGIFKPVFWLSKLLHEAPGTLLVEDDLDESGIVRAFVVKNEEGNSYCMYGVNFNRDEESATLKLHIQNLPVDVKEWAYKTYKIGHEDGNPYHDDVEFEIEALLQPIIDEIENTPGATHRDYIDEAWPVISKINAWESIRPTETERVIPGNRAEMSTQITLEAQEVRVLCIEAI